MGMTKSALLVPLFVLAALALGGSDAHAQTPFIDGNPDYAHTTCNAGGTFVDEAATAVETGVFAGVAPRIGQVTYVHAVAQSLSACGNSDTVWFELVLPADATFAISAANPVFCYRGHDSVYAPVTNDALGACSQVASQGAKGMSFGFSAVGSSNGSFGPWWYEVQVPVIFNAAGAQTVTSWARSAWRFPSNGYDNWAATSVTANVLPSSMLPPPTPASFGNYSATSNANGDAVDARFAITTNFQVGTVSVEWGTSTSFGNLTDPATTHLLESGYPNVTATLFNTPSATTIYWRPRFTVGGLTFVGATQSVRTNAFPAPRPFPTFPRPCRGFCRA